MAEINLTPQDWDIRLYIYDVLVTTGKAPSYQATAQQFAIDAEEARLAYHRLNAGHALFLRPDSDEIMMAHPLSAIETDYQVQVDEVTVYANCAWDSLGIPAMLGKDAHITVTHPISREIITYDVIDGNLHTDDGGYVHFLLPFTQWYDDLIDT